MKEELVITNNSLKDIINWLKNGYIVCIHSYSRQMYYYSEEILDEPLINDKSIIYVNVKKMSSLLDEGEWPWYIKNEGFVEYKSTNILPTNKDNIYIISM
jgi:hypothetical protein